jgi:hypothetical protein
MKFPVLCSKRHLADLRRRPNARTGPRGPAATCDMMVEIGPGRAVPADRAERARSRNQHGTRGRSACHYGLRIALRVPAAPSPRYAVWL